MLPGMDGMTVCAELRKNNVHTPILMLTAKGQVQDTVEELLARIRALTGKEFSLLEYLIRNTGKILSKDHITSHVWNS